MANVEERVKQIIIEHLGVDESKVVDTANFADDLGADSLDQAELVMKLEDAFGCEIPDEASHKITTIKAAVDYIQSQIN